MCPYVTANRLCLQLFFQGPPCKHQQVFYGHISGTDIRFQIAFLKESFMEHYIVLTSQVNHNMVWVT